jgi:hypothetical protein
LAAALTLDIVAAVKEALRDATIRDQIRAMVLEFASLPANDVVEDLVDVRAAAAFLGMTPHALRMAVFRGAVPSLRIGRRLRFRRSDLVARFHLDAG